MDSNADLLKLLKKKPPPDFGEIDYDQQIFDSLIVGTIISEDVPTIIVLCGPPGSGKSTIKQRLIDRYNITNYININPDDIRTLLTSQSIGMVFDDTKPTIMSGITNNFNSRILEQAYKQKNNIIFDSTGQNMSAILSALKTTEGYHKVFVGIYTSKANCLERVGRRNAESSARKELPLEIAEKIYDGFMMFKGTLSNYLIDYPINVNERLLYNNDSFEPVLLYHNVGEVTDWVVPTENFYNFNIIGTKPYFVKNGEGGPKGSAKGGPKGSAKGGRKRTYKKRARKYSRKIKLRNGKRSFKRKKGGKKCNTKRKRI
jgi:adenylate kinase family enzyme